MRKNNFTIFFIAFVIIAAILTLPSVAKADPPGPGGNCGDPGIDCPVDGGVLTLAIISASIGMKRLRKKKNIVTLYK